MKLWIVFIVFSSFVGVVHGQVNKCVDASGKTVYSQGACPKDSKASKIAAPPAPVQAGAGVKPGDSGKASAPKTTAELEQDFRKRQQEQADARKKDEDRLAEIKNNQENCDAARRQLAGFELGGRQSSINEKGERIFLDDAQIEQEKQRARQAVTLSCK